MSLYCANKWIMEDEKPMNKFKIIAFIAVAVLIVTSSGTLYSKNVQAKSLIESFKKSLDDNNYEEALAIKNKADGDIIIQRLYGFSDNTKNISQIEFNNLKDSYLADKITYDDLNSCINQLENLNVFKLSLDEERTLEAIEVSRKTFRTAEDYYNNNDFISSMNTLNQLENNIDENYKPKITKLKLLISDAIEQSLEASIDKFLDKGDYNEALNALNDKKSLISTQLYNEKAKEINDFKDKKLKEAEVKRKAAEERRKQIEEQKKKALEEAQKREEAQLASYLIGYTSNPSKESVVRNFSSRTRFLVWVDIPSQTTNIFVGNKGDWKLIKSFISSTGKPGDETPKGTFTIKDRGTWFFSEKYQEGAKNWVRIFGNYLFHSLPMDRNRQVVDATLGTPASHGCIRLSLDNIQWFYNNISSGTTVYIK